MAILNVDSCNTILTEIEKNQKVSYLLQQLKLHDVESFLHSMRVGELAYRFGRHLQLSSEEVIKLLNIGIIHDLGKLKVPRTIIKKKGPLDEEEWTIIKKHVIYGEELLFDLVESIELDAVLNHHENIDGSGYLGLAGEQISFYSRIIRILDSFDAMSNDRHYQKRRTIKKSLLELESLSNTHYDSMLVQEFIGFLNK